MSIGRRIAALLLAVAVLVSGCAGASQQDIRDLIKKWNDNDLETIMHALFGTSTGNAGKDGVIDSATRIDEQDAAMKDAIAARNAGDTAALDALIAKYPSDYSFKIMRGALALSQGDTSEFVYQYSAVSVTGQLGPLNTKIVELRAISPLVEGKWKSVNQCDEYYGSLAQLYRQRYDLSHRQADLDKAAQYDQTHTSTCGAIPR